MSPRSASAPCPQAPAHLDATSRRWLAELRETHPAHHDAVAQLHAMLRRVAAHELARRRPQLQSVSGPEFDDLVHQAVGDALITILSRLDDFEGRSRFSTWAFGFVIFEVSAKVSRHAWHRQAPGLAEDDVALMFDRRPPTPGEQLDQRLRLRLLARAIAELTERQREVFVAVALNDVPVGDVAARLGTNSNAVYKNLFDARRALRRTLVRARD